MPWLSGPRCLSDATIRLPCSSSGMLLSGDATSPAIPHILLSLLLVWYGRNLTEEVRISDYVTDIPWLCQVNSVGVFEINSEIDFSTEAGAGTALKSQSDCYTDNTGIYSGIHLPDASQIEDIQRKVCEVLLQLRSSVKYIK